MTKPTNEAPDLEPPTQPIDMQALFNEMFEARLAELEALVQRQQVRLAHLATFGVLPLDS